MSCKPILKDVCCLPIGRRLDCVDVHLHNTAELFTDDDVEYHLRTWARWQFGSRYGSLRRLWFAGNASGRMASGSSTFEDLCDSADDQRARVINALVDDLVPMQRCAVHHVHLTSVYRFPRSTLEATYAQALLALRRGMVRKGIFV